MAEVYIGITKSAQENKRIEDFWGLSATPDEKSVSIPFRELDFDGIVEIVNNSLNGLYGGKAKSRMDEVLNEVRSRRDTEPNVDDVALALYNHIADREDYPEFPIHVEKSSPFGQWWAIEQERKRRESVPMLGAKQNPHAMGWSEMTMKDRALLVEMIHKGEIENISRRVKSAVDFEVGEADGNYRQAAFKLHQNPVTQEAIFVDPNVQRWAKERSEEIEKGARERKAKEEAARKKAKEKTTEKKRTPEQEAIHQDIIGQERWGGPGGLQLREVPKARKSIKGAPK